MTYDTLKSQGLRKAFTLIEIDLDINDPALNAEFALQLDSYGTPRTTDDIRAFTGTDFRTYRYSDQQLFGVDHFPNLKKVTSNAPKIDPGKSIGFRATATAVIDDFTTNDAYELPTPYDDRRLSGSHFLKLLARNHVKNRRIRVIKGFDPFNYATANTQIESYVIDSISQPNESGQVQIKMVDELILVESTKAKMPTVSKGVLVGDIDNAVTALTFSSVITDEYGIITSTGYIAIEKEIMSYTVDTATTMTMVRAQFGTEAKSHNSDETMQKCVYFNNVNIIDIFTDIVTNYSKIPASYIDTVNWNALKAGDLSEYNLTNLIYKPTDVKKILNSLIKLAGMSAYVDIVENKFKLIAVPDFGLPVITLNETEHIIQGSVRVLQDYKNQITRCSIFWDKGDLTESDDEKNYRKKFQVIDGIVEADADIGEVSEPKPLKTNWLINSAEDNQLASSFCQREVNRFSQIPLVVTFDVDQRYIGSVSGGEMYLGSVFNIDTSKIKDASLNNVITTCQCVKIKPSSKFGHYTITGLSYTASTPITADLFITSDKVDYLLTDDLVTDTAREYSVVINSGVTIGSSTSVNKSFTQGAFFAGATLKITNLGRIIGTGGDGGLGGIAGTPGVACTAGGGFSGDTGGDAISLTTDTIVDNGFGLILAGGGGGNGGNGVCYEDQAGDFFSDGGSGGGGGQGYSPSAGGLADINGTQDGAGGTMLSGGLGGIAGDSGFGSGQNGSVFGGARSGLAIKTNGNTVTFTSGNNSEQVRGNVT